MPETQERGFAWLRPVGGVRIPIPNTGRTLSQAGERVILTTYWRRRLREGSVERFTPERSVPEAAAPAPKKPRRAKED